MLGAIIGDLAGSVYEYEQTRHLECQALCRPPSVPSYIRT